MSTTPNPPSTLVTIRNEVGGLEVIDTAWDVITRNWYDAMATAGVFFPYEQVAAIDTVIKTLKSSIIPPNDMALIPGKDASGNLWFAVVKTDGTTVAYTNGPTTVEADDMPAGWEAVSPVGPEGKSAYEVAQGTGFSGTVLEWLASLVGPPGTVTATALLAMLANGDITAAIVDGQVQLSGNYIPKTIADGTVLKVDLYSTNPYLGQASRQFQFGDITNPITDASNFQKGAVLMLMQEKTRGSNNPGLFGLHVTGTGSANGLYWWGYGENGKVFPALTTRSDFGLENPFEKGFLHRAICQERTDGGECVVYELECRSAGISPSNNSRFHVGNSAFTDKRTVLYRIRTGGFIRFDVGATGWVQHYGATKVPVTTFAGDLALNETHDTVIYTGPGLVHTLTLPDPADAWYKGMKRTIINHGGEALNLSRPVWYDGQTSSSVLLFAAPNNKIEIVCDGTKWVVC